MEQHREQQDREREREVGVRETFGLCTDREWVDWVVEHGIDGGTIMMLGIHLSEAEVADMKARRERSRAISEALAATELVSSADMWIDQAAGGVVRVLLAHPDESERTIAEQIVATHGGVVELVEHSTGELEEVIAVIDDERDRHPVLAEKMGGYYIDVTTNVVSLMLRTDTAPSEIPESLQAAVTAGMLRIQYADRVKATAL